MWHLLQSLGEVINGRKHSVPPYSQGNGGTEQPRYWPLRTERLTEDAC